jgi:outer membrane protein TolC
LAQLSAVAIQLRRLHASVLLVKALGGGWQNDKAVQSDVATR